MTVEMLSAEQTSAILIISPFLAAFVCYLIRVSAARSFVVLITGGVFFHVAHLWNDRLLLQREGTPFDRDTYLAMRAHHNAGLGLTITGGVLALGGLLSIVLGYRFGQPRRAKRHVEILPFLGPQTGVVLRGRF